ncbi:kelch-like protein 18 isoform X2 [Parasteatoda tepidariorum]|uniref:kelch-like protein 18 isoform X2 n=1 Tax=Parasteatoda tepidariorum TaxID=114398 RepID=UPI001C7237D1|nr:kelch-like protein 18 isoform X2 [Parasteatoda tepidariorum]
MRLRKLFAVDNNRFFAHRVILAGTIPYFHAMFTHDMVESTQKEITIKEIDPEALDLLIDFAYSGKIYINSRNVQSVLVGASFLQLHKVRDACCEFMKKRLHPNNVLGIRTFADALGCSMLVDATNRFIQMHFIEVARSEEFLNLQFSDIRDIVGRDELHTTTEEQVFESVMAWVKNDLARMKHLPELLTQVRMPLLTPQYLTDHVATEELIRTSHQCRDLLDEAKDYHLMPERRPLLQSFRTRPRCCPDIIGCIYAVGGLTKSGDSLSTVEVYDPKIGRWQMAEAMTMLRSRVGVAVMHNKLYAIGGYNGTERLSTVEVFDPGHRTWSTAASMNCKRSAVGAATLFNKLYVCGGYDGISSLNTVECYDPETNGWSMVTSMSKHRSAAGVVAFDDHIYALGGHDGLSIFDSMERYNPQTGQWTNMPPMLSKRCRLGVATLNGNIYVCGGYDGATFLLTAEVYNPSTKQWKYIAPMNVMRSRVALAANFGKLYAIGGYDGTTNLNSVEVYNPETNRWEFVASMCAHEGGVGVGVIPSL